MQYANDILINNLYNLFANYNISQTKFATRAKLNHATLSRILKKKMPLTEKSLFKINNAVSDMIGTEINIVEQNLQEIRKKEQNHKKLDDFHPDDVRKFSKHEIDFLISLRKIYSSQEVEVSPEYLNSLLDHVALTGFDIDLIKTFNEMLRKARGKSDEADQRRRKTNYRTQKTH